MDDPLRYHQQAAEAAEEQLLIERKRLRSIVIGRLLAFFLIALVLWLTWDKALWISFGGGLLSLSLFLVLVRMHARRSEIKEWFEKRASLHRKDLARLRGEMTEEGKGECPEPEHAFADDLDLFADKGLIAWIDRSFSQLGYQKLVHKLMHPSEDAERIERQQRGVAELAERPEQRMDWRVTGRKLQGLAEVDEGRKGFPPLLPVFFRVLIPLVMVTLLVLVSVGILPFKVFVFSLILPIAVLGSRAGRVADAFRRMEKDREAIRGVGDILKRVEGMELSSERLVQEQDKLTTQEGTKASHALKTLDRILEAYEARSNPFVGIVLNLAFLWDLQCYERLRRWDEHYGAELSDWVDVVGEFDALSSLAAVAYDHPSFCYPEPCLEGTVMEGQALGHPLIPQDERVDNDLEIPSTGHIKIVTGANMAGKSTFLRTIGVNWILAKAGAAVCAQSMRFRPLALFSSMRTSDDLAEHESFFYAELKRLRLIVDELEQGKELLILLDEILQGTNSEDKKQGSRRFLERILQYPVAGLIATHDLDLTRMEESHPGQIENLCFEAELHEGRSTFDHLVRQGVCRNMNASALMDRMGIG